MPKIAITDGERVSIDGKDVGLIVDSLINWPRLSREIGSTYVNHKAAEADGEAVKAAELAGEMTARIDYEKQLAEHHTGLMLLAEQHQATMKIHEEEFAEYKRQHDHKVSAAQEQLQTTQALLTVTQSQLKSVQADPPPDKFAALEARLVKLEAAAE